MANFIIGVVIVLFLIIAYLLFRIQTLVSLSKKSKERVGMSNSVNGALMVIVPLIGLILAIWYSGVAAQYFLPEAASVHGQATDDLFWITMGIIIAMFLITNIALFGISFLYQYRKGAKSSYFHDNTRLETIWTIVPAVIMAILVFYGNKVWWDIKSPEFKEKPIQLEIMGHQFAWKVRYPGPDDSLGTYDFRLIDNINEMGIDFEDKASSDDFMPSEIHIPVNKPIIFKIRARDVLHSVFAPHFRLKMDAVPGMPTHFAFIPTKTTQQMRNDLGNPDFNYEIACTEVCGKGHFAMKYIIVVESEEEYKKWLAEQTPFLESYPEYKGKGMSQFDKRNITSEIKEKQQAGL